jgi:hypothetical protein
MADPLALEGRRLALAASLARQARRLVPESPADPAGLAAAAETLAAAVHPRIRFDPPYPGEGEPEDAGGRLRLVLACRASDERGRGLGTVFTTLIAGRQPSVSVAPAGTPLSH